MNLFRTQESLTESDIERGSRLLVVDGVLATGMGALAGGPFLAAFALALGATHYQVGLLATIALLSQVMQLPGLMLVNAYPKRRAISTLLAGLSRLLWIPIALIPIWFMTRGVHALLLLFLAAALVGATVGPAWNALLRDIIPSDRFGRVFARRMVLGTVLALVLTLTGGWFVDWWTVRFPGNALYAYTFLFLAAVAFGLAASAAVARLPETTVHAAGRSSIISLLAKPFGDRNFRRLLIFISFWSFAVNMAAPFFIIYMLQRIGISLGMVTLLTVVSQLAHILFLNFWGSVADRFSSKSVLLVSGPLFLLSVLAWNFTTLPERYVLTMPLLFMIHIISGSALAGVNIGASAIALKLSPSERAHGHMTVFSLVASLAGAVGPAVGGVLADYFGRRELAITLHWSDPLHELSVIAMNFKALDFVFLLAFAVGLFAIHRLAFVKEEGEVPHGRVLSELIDQVTLPFRIISSVEGVRNRMAMPVAAVLRAVRRQRPQGQAAETERDAGEQD